MLYPTACIDSWEWHREAENTKTKEDATYRMVGSRVVHRGRGPGGAVHTADAQGEHAEHKRLHALCECDESTKESASLEADHAAIRQRVLSVLP